MTTKNKTIVVYSPSRFPGEVWLPALWSQSKTYYEKHGKKVNEWYWYPCYADVWGNDLKKVKSIIQDAKPDVFAISLYVWSSNTAFTIAKWVKENFPNCLIVSGGPHQDFKYNEKWFSEHPYLDCSLPGEKFGELCFSEILDNYSSNIDLDDISDIVYPQGEKRTLTASKKTLTKRKLFDYEWCSYAEQQKEICKFAEYAKSQFINCHVGAIVETTRGCPYGCTYCDWGGGINTKVIKKNFFTVAKDLDFLLTLNLKILFIADANFGIFGDRDVSIIKHLTHCREKNQSITEVGYGGFAKTENRLKYIFEIFKFDLENNLSFTEEIKISQQTLDKDILKNIDRVNIPLDKQLETLSPLGKKNKIPLFVEIIMGLPGMSLDKFYYELDEFGKKNLSVLFYEWILLPEAPAYDPEYRKKHQLKTIKKTVGWGFEESGTEREIVVGGKYFTPTQYLEMMLACSLYYAIIQGGFLKHSIHHMDKPVGQIIKLIVQWHLHNNPELLCQWKKILDDPEQPCTLTIKGDPIFIMLYFPALLHANPNNFVSQLFNFLSKLPDAPSLRLWWDHKQHADVKNTNRSIDEIVQDFFVRRKTGSILRKKQRSVF